MSLLFGTTALVLAVLIWRLRAVNRAAALNNRGLTLVGEGRYVEAMALFEQARRGLLISPLPRYNVAHAQLWLWRLNEARDGLERNSRGMRGRPLRLLAVPALLLIAALTDDQAGAEALEAELRALGGERSAVASVARAVFRARAGDWPAVLELLTLERVRPLGGPARALAEALRAWALASLGRPVPEVDVVGILGETGPQAVRAYWPQFADFLVSQARAPGS